MRVEVSLAGSDRQGLRMASGGNVGSFRWQNSFLLFAGLLQSTAKTKTERETVKQGGLREMRDNQPVLREDAFRLAAAFAVSSERAVAALNTGDDGSGEAVDDCLTEGRAYGEALGRKLMLLGSEPWGRGFVEEAGRIEGCRALLRRELDMISKHPARRR
jgi:hypothetical protein